ncbi:MAG: hypothetical protein AAGF33_15660 [Pseudomonadota bacterium]
MKKLAYIAGVKALAVASFMMMSSMANALVIGPLAFNIDPSTDIALIETPVDLAAGESFTGIVELTADPGDTPLSAITGAVLLELPDITALDLANSSLSVTNSAGTTSVNLVQTGLFTAEASLSLLFTDPDFLVQTITLEFAALSAVESVQVNLGVVAIPLPAPILMLGAGLAGLGFAARRRRKVAA